MNKHYRNIVNTSGLWGAISLAMSLLACYGTLALVGLMSALGVGLAINEGLWAGAILIFAWAAVALIALGARVHDSFKPVAIALAGAVPLTYTLLVDYRPAIEIAAFVLLAFACGYDILRRKSAVGIRAARPC